MPPQTPTKESSGRRNPKASPSTTLSTESREAFIDPFSDPTLAAYLANVRDWHGYIRFLGLPHLRENPDILIDKLYVEPLLADSYVSPDTPPEAWPEVETVLQTLVKHQRLVLLGDPGSGKSTLVSWLAWQFAQPTTNEWVQQFGQLVPIPIVLRELEIGKDSSWEGLVRAFLKHDMAKPLGDGSMLRELLKRGQALIMLDGLDEIGDVATRTALRTAITAGMLTHRSCRWLMTSRIVGYDAVPFHKLPTDQRDTEAENLRREFGHTVPPSVLSLFRSDSLNKVVQVYFGILGTGKLLYVVPFNDDQIRRFARNWFSQREAAREKAEREAINLIAAFHEDPATTRLARVPNLLTMMALIHRVRARLPHGRALLYNEITQAYLQSIDEYRGLKEEYPYVQKRRWLARVGFEMQRRRSALPDHSQDVSRDILVTDQDVIKWIAAGMREWDSRLNEQTAAAFVEWIGRRSGLLLPRGPGQFAFMHLSFQEYFAACFLVEQVMSPSYIRNGKAAAGAERDDLRRYAREFLWRETLVFLFELLADQPDWPKTLAEDLFGADFADLSPDAGKDHGAAVLLARLAIDPHSGLSGELRKKAISACWRMEIPAQSDSLITTEIARLLFAAEPDQLPVVWDSLTSAVGASKVTRLSLNGCRGVESIARLSGLPLEALSVAATSLINLNGVQELPSLSYLNITMTLVTDLSPLGTLSNLHTLSLSDTAITDLSPLSKVKNLQQLFLYPIGTGDKLPLTALNKLTLLSIGGTDEIDLAFVTKMRGLTELGVWDTYVTNLDPLIGLKKLKRLYLIRTNVVDFNALSQLGSLESLELIECNITNLEPLRSLRQLERLNLSQTEVTDLRPIARLESLKQLSLNATNVSDLSPLHHLPRLETITALETNISDAQIDALQKALPKIQIAR